MRQRQTLSLIARRIAWVWPANLVFAIVFLVMAFFAGRDGYVPGMSRLASNMLWYSVSAVGVLLNVGSVALDLRRAVLGVPILFVYLAGNVPDLLPVDDLLFILWLVVPLPALVVVTLLGVGLMVVGFRHRSVELSLLLLLAAIQLLLLGAWLFGFTAWAPFGWLRLRLTLGRVLDPRIERVAMTVFRGLAAPILLVAAGRSLWRVVQVGPDRRWTMRVIRGFAFFYLALVLLCIYANDPRYVRMDSVLADSTSPDETKQVLLVPVAGWTDIHGVVLWRPQGAFWWRPVDILVDAFTFAESVAFAWDDDSRRSLLLRDGEGFFFVEFRENGGRPVGRWVKEEPP